MLISLLTNIGKAMKYGKDSVSLIIDSQKPKFAKVEKTIICKLNLDSGDFELLEQEFDVEKIDSYLPGIAGGTSHNFSPMIAIKTQKTQNNKKFEDLKPEDMINYKKINKFNEIDKESSSPVNIFGVWLEKNISLLQNKVHEYYSKNYLQENKKKEIVIDSKAPKYLQFYLIFEGEEFFPGDREEFREVYLKIKESSQTQKKAKTDEKNDACCLACGKVKEDVLKLEKCKFYDFYSLDQAAFQLLFTKNSKQAVICKECEENFRNGYNIANSLLRFRAFQIQTSLSKSKYIDHMILPLTNNPTHIQNYIKYVKRFRKNIYENKEKTMKEKLHKLNDALKNTEKKKAAEIKKKIKEQEKKIKEFETSDEIDGSKWINENYFEILKHAADEGFGILDLYFEETTAGSSRKKVVYDVLLGSKSQISIILDLIHQTDDFYNHSVKFEFGKLFQVFGEKTGKKIIQNLFSNSKIKISELTRSAYHHFYQDFRTWVKNNQTATDYKIGFSVFNGPKIFHYTNYLLNKAKLLILS